MKSFRWSTTTNQKKVSSLSRSSFDRQLVDSQIKILSRNSSLRETCVEVNAPSCWLSKVLSWSWTSFLKTNPCWTHEIGSDKTLLNITLSWLFVHIKLVSPQAAQLESSKFFGKISLSINVAPPVQVHLTEKIQRGKSSEAVRNLNPWPLNQEACALPLRRYNCCPSLKIGSVVVAQVVGYWTTDWEVPSSIPTGSWAFFNSSLFSISQTVVCLLTACRCNTTDFQLSRLSCAASGESCLICTEWEKKFEKSI